MRIHLLGPSGSGTTTLGRELARRLSIPHLDSDDLFWEKTDPPFSRRRLRGERESLLAQFITRSPEWIVSGSALEWGDILLEKADLMIWLHLDTRVRIQRLIAREKARFGRRIDEGNDMHQNHQEFIQWAERYDTAGMEQRSRVSEGKWLEGARGRVLELDGAEKVQVLADTVIREIGAG